MEPTVVCNRLEDGIEILLWVKSQGRQDRQGRLVRHVCFLPFVRTFAETNCVIVADCATCCTFLAGQRTDCGVGNCFDRDPTLLYSTIDWSAVEIVHRPGEVETSYAHLALRRLREVLPRATPRVA